MQQRFLLQILLLAQHVSGITMPIIRSSRVTMMHGQNHIKLVFSVFKSEGSYLSVETTR